MRIQTALFATALIALGSAPRASAGEFDDRGVYVADENASAFETFESSPTHYLPPSTDTTCQIERYELIEPADDALDGSSYLRVATTSDCPESFPLAMPAEKGSYHVRLWIRHGSADARLVVEYPEELAVLSQTARLAPTGRVTSDGWLELASNDLPIDGTLSPIVYLRFSDFAYETGVDLDAVELTKGAEYRELPTCSGAVDPVCGDDAVCYGGQCRLGALSVPPLPDQAIRDEVVDSLEFKLRNFFGGRKTRLEDLPVALATLTSIRDSATPWQFWNGFARAIRELHDWHTSAHGAITDGSVAGRLNACFIEGDADLTHAVAPSHALYKDILVSHVGSDGTAGLHAGDRLVAVDGKHPIEWARELIALDWGYHIACDATSFADFAEDLGGSSGGGALIRKYATTFSVVRCDAVAGTCADAIETLNVAELPAAAVGSTVACDNRPTYHLGPASPGPNHDVFYTFYQGKIDGTSDDEAIYGMVFDTLYGGGDPNGFVNGTIRSAVTQWKANARGVILDHRAGNGGTVDAPQYMTELVRPQEIAAVMLAPIEVAGWDGPETTAAGMGAFNRAKQDAAFTVGSADYDPSLPVALILHRDGSASDYLPQGMKGAPKVKLFGPGPTAGAFSTFITFVYWGGITFQIASGDTITNQGVPLIGSGVVPDVVVQQKQSDLVAGVDTIHEAALAWVRQELKP